MSPVSRATFRFHEKTEQRKRPKIFSMASSSPSIPPQATSEGIAALESLPSARTEHNSLPPQQLRAALHLLNAFLANPSGKAPPSKELLSNAVQALLPAGQRLARKWRKEQLATVLVKWVVQALRLRPLSLQKDLLVKVSVSDSDPKKMTHSCFLVEEGSDAVASFTLSSPSPIKARSPERGESETGVPILEARNEFENIEGLDEAFLKEIDTLAARADLANIPTNFYTPRVQNANGAPSDGGSSCLAQLANCLSGFSPFACFRKPSGWPPAYIIFSLLFTQAIPPRAMRPGKAHSLKPGLPRHLPPSRLRKPRPPQGAAFQRPPLPTAKPVKDLALPVLQKVPGKILY